MGTRTVTLPRGIPHGSVELAIPGTFPIPKRANRPHKRSNPGDRPDLDRDGIVQAFRSWDTGTKKGVPRGHPLV